MPILQVFYAAPLELFFLFFFYLQTFHPYRVLKMQLIARIYLFIYNNSLFRDFYKFYPLPEFDSGSGVMKSINFTISSWKLELHWFIIKLIFLVLFLFTIFAIDISPLRGFNKKIYFNSVSFLTV